VSEAVAAEYNRVIQAILDIDYVVDGKPVPVRAILTPDAFEHFASWYRDCGADLNVCAQQGYTFLATWLGKLREHVARLALLFAVVEAVETGAPLASPIQVTLAHLTAAAVVCEHLKLHARRAGIIVGETEEMAAARRVWRWLAVNGAKLRSAREAEGCGAVHAAKVRDLLRAGLPGCTTSKAAGLILVELAARGYVQKVDWQIPGGPKRLHELWFVHPTARR
jgi:hypothetical protein